MRAWWEGTGTDPDIEYKKPAWLKERVSRKPHRLPKGWRGLKMGEKTRVGDVCCDVRIQPVKIIVGGIRMTKNHHPVRRQVAAHPSSRDTGRK